MFQLINAIILRFRPCFKREKTWQWFASSVVALIIRSEHRGVSSTMSALGYESRYYEQLLHYYHSSAYTVGELYEKWREVAKEYLTYAEEGGYVVLAADPIKVPKEGKRMPGVHTYHQESENAGKKEYTEGHQFGMVCAIAVSGSESRSIPLVAGLQESKTTTGKDSLIEQMVNQGGEVLPGFWKPGLLVLDAYYCAGSTFKTAKNYRDENGRPQMAVITRAKIDTVGYTQPLPRQIGQQ